MPLVSFPQVRFAAAGDQRLDGLEQLRLTRIHVPGKLEAGGEIALPAQAGEHLTRVLRLAAGAHFVLFNGDGGEYAAEIASTGKPVRARVLRHEPIERESPLHVTLLPRFHRLPGTCRHRRWMSCWHVHNSIAACCGSQCGGRPARASRRVQTSREPAMPR